MKHLNLLSGIIIGVAFCLLISANSKTTLNEDIPRYHVTWTGIDMAMAYDAITGEYKTITIKEAKNATNIKTLLETKDNK